MNSIFLLDKDNNIISKKSCMSYKNKIDDSYCCLLDSFAGNFAHYISFGEEDILELVLKTHKIYIYKFIDIINISTFCEFESHEIKRTFIELDTEIKPEDATIGTIYKWVGFASKIRLDSELVVGLNEQDLISDLNFEKIEEFTNPIKIRTRKLDKI